MATADWAIAHGDALFVLSHLPSGVAQCVVTSPPYFGLRSYGTEPIVWPAVSYAPMPGLPELHFPGDPECAHEWGEEQPSFHPGQVPDSKWKNNKAVAEGGNDGRGAYCQRCGAWRGNLGLEPTPEAFVAHLVAIFREVKRVLADTGVAWVNMGDSYASPGKGGPWDEKRTQKGTGRALYSQQANRGELPGLKTKDLMGIPWRLAFALQADGWYLRSDVIWQKPNPMPESVTDRPTKSHEHIFLLAKSDRYFYDADAIREPLAEATLEREQYGYNHAFANQFRGSPTDKRYPDGKKLEPGLSPAQGRNRRDVWSITTKPWSEAHFAVFPPELPDICIRAGTSERGQCPTCGAPHERVVEKSTEFHSGSGKAGRTAEEVNANGKWAGKQYGKNLLLGPVNRTQTVGWRPTCECPAHEPVPQLILDPFSGAGTTGMVALRLGRRYIGIEPNAEYVRMSERRIIDDAPLFNLPAKVSAEEVA